MRDEIAVLKGEKPKPTFKSSGMEKQTDPDATDGSDGDGESKGKRPGSAKPHKTQDLIIHEECPILLREVPAGARFTGYPEKDLPETRDFVPGLPERSDRAGGCDPPFARNHSRTGVGGRGYAVSY